MSTTTTTTNFPAIPVAASTVLRVFFAVLAFVTRWLKERGRVRRHRREAAALAGLDRRMLADIGISRADLRDAFSQPFWGDPTTLLRERVNERRANRDVLGVASGFRRPPTDRAARLTV